MSANFRSALAALIAAFSLLAAPAAAQTVLRYNLWVPPKHFVHVDIMQPWIKAVEQAMQGRVRIESTTTSLSAPPRQFDLAQQSVADITLGVHNYSPGRFVTYSAAELPFMSDSAEALAVAYWRAYEKFFAQAREHDGVKLLGLMVHGPGAISTRQGFFSSLDELKGKKMRVGGEFQGKVMAALGTVPVAAPAPQIYEMLSRGVVDAAVTTLDAVMTFNIVDFVPYLTTVPGALFNSSFFLVMNQAKWDALSAQDKEAVWSVSGEAFARAAGRAWDANDALAGRTMAAKGLKVRAAEGKLLDDIRAAVAPLEGEWIAAAARKNVDGKAALVFMREQVKAYGR